MGDDSTPRTVLTLGRGTDEMYDIVEQGKRGVSYRVNSEHILCVYNKQTGDYEEITVRDYLNLDASQQKDYQAYRVPITFRHCAREPVEHNPYVVSMWLACGGFTKSLVIGSVNQRACTSCVKITNIPILSMPCLNPIAITAYRKMFSDANLETSIISGSTLRLRPKSQKHGVRVMNYLCSLGVDSEHVSIPKCYKTASRYERLQVLAAFTDVCGYVDAKRGHLILKESRTKLAEDLVFVARSVGLVAHQINKCVRISGSRLKQIPVKASSKKHALATASRLHSARGNHELHYDFNVVATGKGNYYGFTIDGNHKYVMGDLSVTHLSLIHI